MDWKTLLTYISGSVDEHLLLRIEYLVAEKFDGSTQRKPQGRPRVDKELEDLVIHSVDPGRSGDLLRLVLHQA